MPDWKNLNVNTLPKPNKADFPIPIIEHIATNLQYELTLETLTEHIQIFANSRKEEGKMVEYSIFHDRNFEWVGINIVFNLDNEMQLLHFTNVKATFVNYLKNIYSITFNVEASVNESKAKVMVYSQSDKFKYLASQYPHLEELKRKLGLEVEF